MRNNIVYDTLYALDLANGTNRRERKHDQDFRDAGGYINGAYPYIPLDYYEFQGALSRAQAWLNANQKHFFSFMDVGAGNGMKMAMAKSFGFSEVYGVEIDPALIAKASFLFPDIACNIVQGDGREFPDYAKMDVIYFYCPMVDHEMQLQLEKAIYDNAKEGTVLIQFLKKTDFGKESLASIGDCVHIKTTSRAVKQNAKWFREGYIAGRRSGRSYE